MPKSESTRLSFPLFGLILAFVLWTFVGALIGFVYLSFKAPKAIASNQSLVPDSGTGERPFFHINKEVRYYKTQSFHHRAEALAKQLFASTTNEIEISSADLNGWARAQFNAQGVRDTGSGEGKSYIALNPGVPEFQIAAGELHISYPCTAEILGRKFDVLVLTSGVFESENHTPTWKMDKLYLNSAPIPFEQTLYHLVKPYAMKVISKNEEVEKLKSAWGVIKEIEITGSTMLVRRK